MALHFGKDVLVWTFYFEKPGKTLDLPRLQEWDEAMEDSFGAAIDSACEKLQIEPSKANRSAVLALAVVTRGSELAARVRTAARFFKSSVLANELL